MSELSLLQILLLAAMAVGPLGTHRHFAAGPARSRTIAHVVALTCAAIGLASPWPQLCVVWLLYCAGSFALFLASRFRALGSPPVLASCVPFLFSNVAAVWLVAGANDLYLLGYGAHFSNYAALHGNVLGWVLLGGIAILANREGSARVRHVYVATVFVCFVSFLLVAFGIDRLHALKPIGIVGLSIALPVAQLTFLRDVKQRHRAAFVLGCVSLAGLVSTMFLAWCHELTVPMLGEFAGIRAMVSVHGVVNALLTAPCFLLAVVLDTSVAPETRSHAGDPPDP